MRRRGLAIKRSECTAGGWAGGRTVTGRAERWRADGRRASRRTGGLSTSGEGWRVVGGRAGGRAACKPEAIADVQAGVQAGVQECGWASERWWMDGLTSWRAVDRDGGR